MKFATFSFVRAAGAAMILFSLAAAGCAPAGVETVEVKGTIVQNGEPLPEGTITFMPKDGVAAPGAGVIENGAFTANVPPGEKWVMVVATKVVGQTPLYAGDPNSPMEDKREQITSPVYNAAHQTPLEAKIDGPTEGLKFELTKDVKPRS